MADRDLRKPNRKNQMIGAIGEEAVIEVKTRSSYAFGHPLEAIDREKAHRLQKLALAWLVTNNYFGSDYQVDVAAVTLNKTLKPLIDYRSGVL